MAAALLPAQGHQRGTGAIAHGQDRILLTLATGTGKTSIAFQIAWKLFGARWNATREPTRRPRILFLADRNILADQAYNSFSAFPSDAITRIDPDTIKKKGGVPRNASVFFTIFQTFTAGDGEANYLAMTRTSSTSSSSTSATGRRRRMRAAGVISSNTSRRPHSWASQQRPSASTTPTPTAISANPFTPTP